jgi:serine/threonine protein kinase
LGCVVLEMLTGKHPWQNLDEIQTMWRLGRFDKPPLPENISDEAKLFLQATFTIDPQLRPTASFLLNHEFIFLDVQQLDFRKYKEAAILKKQQLDMDEDEDSDDQEDEDEDEED